MSSFDSYDLEGDGTVDLWHIDSTGSGYFDQVGFDVTGEGQADTWFSDPNLDGTADHVWTDTTGDGVADVWQYAPAGTSMGWEHLTTPAVGSGAVVGGGGGDWTLTDGSGNPVDIADVMGPSTVGGTGTGYSIVDAAGNPVDPATLQPGMTITGATPMTGLDRALVQARTTGTAWEQFMIWDMIRQQNATIYNGLAF